MKTKLFYLTLLLFVLNSNFKSQCTMSLAPIAAYGGPGTYTIGVNGFIGPFQLCSNVVLYDTMGSSLRSYYLMGGSVLTLKNGFGHNVYMKGNSMLNIIGSGPGVINVFKEINAAVNSTISYNTNSCVAVAFPTIACPAPTVTAIDELSELELISIYPNPVHDQLSIQNPSAEVLNVLIIDALGQKLKSFMIETKSKEVSVADLNAGIYFLVLEDKKGIRKVRSLIITR